MTKKYFGKLFLTSMVVFGLAACGGTPSAATTENAASTPEESMEGDSTAGSFCNTISGSTGIHVTQFNLPLDLYQRRYSCNGRWTVQ